MKRRRIIIIVIGIITGTLTALHDYLAKIADQTSLPSFVKPYLSSVWPVFFVVNAIAAGLTELQKALEQKDTDHPASVQERRNRQRMLARVHALWITGVLEHSLHGAALITLGLNEQRDTVANPWQLVFQQPDPSENPLPLGTSITKIYSDTGGELLILGEPGSGKTTLLLELTRHLLDQAEQDEELQMPVVFHLSSWAAKQQPLAQWLVEELMTKYQVPRKLGQAWVNNDQVLPLLDGFDEVTSNARLACIDAINTYRQEHMVPTVMCSRRTEYLTQTQRVALRNTVVVQPLTVQQIDAYLSSAGNQLAAVRVVLSEDKVLQELATTPLMLSVLTLAYQGKPVEALPREGPPETRRQQVFATYVQHMLQRRITSRYTPEQTKHWLAWLAQQMIQHGQTEFYLEQMQPDWLEEHQSLRRFYRAVVRVSTGLVSGLVSGLGFGLLYGLLYLLVIAGLAPVLFIGRGSGLLGFLAGGLIGGLTMGLTHQTEREIKPAEVVSWSWKSLWQKLAKMEFLKSGLSSGLIVGLLYGLRSGINLGRLFGLFYGLLFGLIGGLIVGLVSRTVSELLGETLEKQPRTMLNQAKRQPAPNSVLVGLGGGLVSGLLVWLLRVLFAWRFFGPSVVLHAGLTYRLLDGLTYGLLGGLLGGLLIGLVNRTVCDLLDGAQDKRPPPFPSQERMSSVRNRVFVGLGSGLVIGPLFGLAVGLVIGLSFGLVAGLSSGLLAGLSSGLLIGLGFGLVSGLLVGLFSGLIIALTHRVRKEVKPREIMSSMRNSVLVGLVGGLVVGLLFGLAIELFFVLGSGQPSELAIGLEGGLLVGLFSGLIIALTHRVRKEVKPREIMSWLRASMWRELMKSQTLKYMLVIGLLYGLLYGLSGGLFVGLSFGLFYGLMSGLVFELMGGLIGGLSSDLLDKQILTKPNQGIQSSARNSVRVGLVGGLVVGLVAGLLFGLVFGLLFGLPVGLRSGLVAGLLVGSLGGLSIGLSQGGAASIQHAVLRMFLRLAGYTPRNYSRFLDYAAERILLRKIGGGYTFIHRLLQDYFASLEPEPTPQQEAPQAQNAPSASQYPKSG